LGKVSLLAKLLQERRARLEERKTMRPYLGNERVIRITLVCGMNIQ
jgi:hypothetical protein